MLSFQFGSYEVLINASVKIHTGHLQVDLRLESSDRVYAWLTWFF